MGKTSIQYDFDKLTFNRADGVVFDASLMTDADEESPVNPEYTNCEALQTLPFQYRREFLRGVHEDVCNVAAAIKEPDEKITAMKEMVAKIYTGDYHGKTALTAEQKAKRAERLAEKKRLREEKLSEIESLKKAEPVDHVALTIAYGKLIDLG